MGQSGRCQGGMGEVWFQFPQPELIPPYEKLDIFCHVLPTTGHWGLDVLFALITNSEALVVILTRHSANSEQVHLEISTYPDSKPVWVMPIRAEPIPEGWKTRRNIHVVEPPISVDLNKMLEIAYSRAREATDKGLHTESYLFYWDAINLLALLNSGDLWIGYNLFALKGQCAIRLSLGKGAVESFQSALTLAELMPDHEEFERLATDNPTASLAMHGGQPPCAMQAHALRDLGAAHMIARHERAADKVLYGLPLSDWQGAIWEKATDRETRVDPDAPAKHLAAAQDCWRRCLSILEKYSSVLTRLSRFPYDELKETCTEFLAKSEREA